MNIAIDIELFKPERPDDVKHGKLYLDEDGKDYVEYAGTWGDAFKLNKVIYAKETVSEERYTLINCAFRKSSSGTYRFVINELYKGGFVDIATDNNCLEAEARMTGLTNWINHPRIKPQITFSMYEESKVIIKEFFTVEFTISENIQLRLCEFCGETYGRYETVLQNLSFIKLVCKQPISRLEMHKNIIAFLELLSIFTDSLPKLTSIDFTLNADEKVEYLTLKRQKRPEETDALLRYDKMESYWPEAVKIFYEQRDKFVRVLDLLIASIKNNTAEISFLNITTAFEVFHKYFQESNNESIRKQLSADLLQEGLIKRDSGKWDQILRYYHLVKLTDGIEFFKQNFQNPLKTIALIRDSRNYYTHYSQPKSEIWTPNRLLFANKLLRQLLKGVLLKELKIPDDLINKLLNNRADIFYQDYENNEYSFLYLQKEATKEASGN